MKGGYKGIDNQFQQDFRHPKSFNHDSEGTVNCGVIVNELAIIAL